MKVKSCVREPEVSYVGLSAGDHVFKLTWNCVNVDEKNDTGFGGQLKVLLTVSGVAEAAKKSADPHHHHLDLTDVNEKLPVLHDEGRTGQIRIGRDHE